MVTISRINWSSIESDSMDIIELSYVTPCDTPCTAEGGLRPRHVPPWDRGRTWCAASRDNVPPRSQTHAGRACSASPATTTPEAGGEATGALTGHVVLDYLPVYNNHLQSEIYF